MAAAGAPQHPSRTEEREWAFTMAHGELINAHSLSLWVCFKFALKYFIIHTIICILCFSIYETLHCVCFSPRFMFDYMCMYVGIQIFKLIAFFCSISYRSSFGIQILFTLTHIRIYLKLYVSYKSSFFSNCCFAEVYKPLPHRMLRIRPVVRWTAFRKPL